MNYIELNCDIKNNTSQWSEILIAQLSEAGFEMFEETGSGFRAYIAQKAFDHTMLRGIDALHYPGTAFTIRVIKHQNWNKLWESNFPTVIIGDVYVRAEFHPPLTQFKHEIIIQPEMSFGTGHHETTKAMMELMLRQNFTGKAVCDMGCGTGILAILAEKLGAKKVTAVDNDEMCIANCKANFVRNNCRNCIAQLGYPALLNESSYDILLANINRNVLLQNASGFGLALNKEGLLFVSGFYHCDFLIIQSEFLNNDFHCRESLVKNSWCAALFEKK